MLGISKLVIHRDGDFMVLAEKKKLKEKFVGSGCELWITEPSDIEGYLCDRDHLIGCLGITDEQAEDFLAEAWKKASDDKAFRAKRAQINKNEKFYAGGAGTPSLEDAKKELDYHYAGSVKGKALLKQLKALLHEQIGTSPKQLYYLQTGGVVAADLKTILDSSK